MISGFYCLQVSRIPVGAALVNPAPWLQLASSSRASYAEPEKKSLGLADALNLKGFTRRQRHPPYIYTQFQ